MSENQTASHTAAPIAKGWAFSVPIWPGKRLSVRIDTAALAAQFKFSSGWDGWMPVLNWIYIGYFLGLTGVDIYAGIVTGDKYAFDAAMGYALVALWMYFWQDMRKLDKKLRGLFVELLEAYKDENAALRNALADTRAKLAKYEPLPTGTPGGSGDAS